MSHTLLRGNILQETFEKQGALFFRRLLKLIDRLTKFTQGDDRTNSVRIDASELGCLQPQGTDGIKCHQQRVKLLNATDWFLAAKRCSWCAEMGIDLINGDLDFPTLTIITDLTQVYH